MFYHNVIDNAKNNLLYKVSYQLSVLTWLQQTDAVDLFVRLSFHAHAYTPAAVLFVTVVSVEL